MYVDGKSVFTNAMSTSQKSKLRLFLRIALCIPSAHNFRVKYNTVSWLASLFSQKRVLGPIDLTFKAEIAFLYSEYGPISIAD